MVDGRQKKHRIKIEIINNKHVVVKWNFVELDWLH